MVQQKLLVSIRTYVNLFSGFIRGKMRPMHFSNNAHRNFWNMGTPFSQPTPWKPHMRLSPYNSPPIASSLVASENNINNNEGRSGTSAETEKGKFVPFIGARKLLTLEYNIPRHDAASTLLDLELSFI